MTHSPLYHVFDRMYGKPSLGNMTDEQLQAHVTRLYNEWMYYEAAERGYDFEAAFEAQGKYLRARRELELRKAAL